MTIRTKHSANTSANIKSTNEYETPTFMKFSTIFRTDNCHNFSVCRINVYNRCTGILSAHCSKSLDTNFCFRTIRNGRDDKKNTEKIISLPMVVGAFQQSDLYKHISIQFFFLSISDANKTKCNMKIDKGISVKSAYFLMHRYVILSRSFSCFVHSGVIYMGSQQTESSKIKM